VASTGEARSTYYITCFKASKKILAGEKRVDERVLYNMYFDTVSSERGDNVEGLLSAMEGKRLKVYITSATTSATSICRRIQGGQTEVFV
jgi:hypothetical protein